MFCYQCEQTARGTGCVTRGVCGKSPEASDLQDVLVHAAKRLATRYANVPAAERPASLAPMLEDALFVTVTNVNFDTASILGKIREVVAAAGAPAAGVAVEAPEDTLLAWSRASMIDSRKASLGDDVTGLQELLLYGLKGMAAYAHHARQMHRADPVVDAFTVEALAKLDAGVSDINELLALNLKCGEVTINVLALLDAAHGDTFGKPTPTPVLMGHVPGKAILISGQC